MSLLPIYNCFNPVLKKKTEKVEHIDENLKKLVENMFETMYNADGIGLAANQVGVSKSLVIIDISRNDNFKNQPPLVLINPEIITFSEEKDEFLEGCLSIPNFYETVDRPEAIEIKFYDLNMKEHKIEANDLLARVMQHEIDHLNGILFFERLSPIKKTLAKSKLKKIKNGQVDAKYEMVNPDGRLYIPK